jgi:hypothetical protein
MRIVCTGRRGRGVLQAVAAGDDGEREQYKESTGCLGFMKFLLMPVA